MQFKNKGESCSLSKSLWVALTVIVRVTRPSHRGRDFWNACPRSQLCLMGPSAISSVIWKTVLTTSQTSAVRSRKRSLDLVTLPLAVVALSQCSTRRKNSKRLEACWQPVGTWKLCSKRRQCRSTQFIWSKSSVHLRLEKFGLSTVYYIISLMLCNFSNYTCKPKSAMLSLCATILSNCMKFSVYNPTISNRSPNF